MGEYWMRPQGACRIHKPASAGNGQAVFPTFESAQPVKEIRFTAADDLLRDSLNSIIAQMNEKAIIFLHIFSPRRVEWRGNFYGSSDKIGRSQGRRKQ